MNRLDCRECEIKFHFLDEFALDIFFFLSLSFNYLESFNIFPNKFHRKTKEMLMLNAVGGKSDVIHRVSVLCVWHFSVAYQTDSKSSSAHTNTFFVVY